MKQIGNLIELDPTKNYICLLRAEDMIDPDLLSLENNTILILDNLENIKFVEKEGDFKEIAIVKEKSQ